MIKLISATSMNSVIGKNNKLPWSGEYPEDMQFFRKMTAGGTVIMGKKTYLSIGRPLPKRRNIVLSRSVDTKIDGVEIFNSLEAALTACSMDAWIIGGSFVYQEALKFADELYITSIPEIISGEGLVYFPYVNPDVFQLTEKLTLNPDKNLYCNFYKRKL